MKTKLHTMLFLLFALYHLAVIPGVAGGEHVHVTMHPILKVGLGGQPDIGHLTVETVRAMNNPQISKNEHCNQAWHYHEFLPLEAQYANLLVQKIRGFSEAEVCSYLGEPLFRVGLEGFLSDSQSSADTHLIYCVGINPIVLDISFENGKCSTAAVETVPSRMLEASSKRRMTIQKLLLEALLMC